jgi:hypothetical protein
MVLLSPYHPTSFAHHATGIKAKGLINPLTDRVIGIRGRGCKAMSGNCCGMRWSEDGFNHLLHLRLAWVNGSFETLFQVQLQPSPNK